MKTDELADHLFGSVLGAFDTLTIAVGAHFGLYDLLHQRPRTSEELAEASGMHPRYAREWCEQQAVSALIDVDDAEKPAEQRRYSLDDEHAAVLSDRDSLGYLTPFAQIVSAAAIQLPALLEAYRTGGGVGWAQYGEMMRVGQADQNRPLFLDLLGSSWLPSLPRANEALKRGGRMADVGCGDGWGVIGAALAYPEATVDGYDIDPDSIAAATAHAAAYGVEERVAFHLVDAAEVPAGAAGSYDVVTALECVHDMPDPVGVLATMRALLVPGGTVLVMDEKVPEQFTGPGDPVEQLMYGISLLVCLPDGMAHDETVATGTVMRPDTLRSYAREAGFAEVEKLPIENDVFRFYRLLDAD